MKNNKEYKIKKKLSLGMRFARRLVRIFMGRYEIVNVSGSELPDKCIILGLHNGMNGPFAYQCYFPKFALPWGAHEMTGNYAERRNYLYNVFYRKKCGMGKVQAFFRSTFLALVSGFFYKGAGVIGTYSDGRQISAIKKSIAALEQDVPVLLFPENSDKGYYELIQGCHAGFVQIVSRYRKLHGVDIPVYPTYLSKKYKRIAIDSPVSVGDMLDKGLRRDEIAERLKLKINALHDKYETPVIQVPATENL